jgi:hypothetical protein
MNVFNTQDNNVENGETQNLEIRTSVARLFYSLPLTLRQEIVKENIAALRAGSNYRDNNV